MLLLLKLSLLLLYPSAAACISCIGHELFWLVNSTAVRQAGRQASCSVRLHNTD
jgi:hypothetical protein